MNRLEQWIQRLSTYRSEQVHNPWGDVDHRFESSDTGHEQRQENLRAYLEPRLQQCKLLVVAEAMGYQGGRFSGIAITCERMLLGHHPTVGPHHIAKDVSRLGRTSNPKSNYIGKAIQREKGFNEPTDTVVWNALLEEGVDPFSVVLWNIFPFHPYTSGKPLSNRTPVEAELDVGWTFTEELLRMLGPVPVLAVGAKAAQTMGRYGVEARALRHPANGGATLYKEQFKGFVKEQGILSC